MYYRLQHIYGSTARGRWGEIRGVNIALTGRYRRGALQGPRWVAPVDPTRPAWVIARGDERCATGAVWAEAARYTPTIGWHPARELLDHWVDAPIVLSGSRTPWRAAIHAELRAHARVPPAALLLQALGLDQDIAPLQLFAATSRHARQTRADATDEVSAWLPYWHAEPRDTMDPARYPPCPECTRLLRVRCWLQRQLMMGVRREEWSWHYSSLRQRLGQTATTGVPVPVWMPRFVARWHASDEREALVVFLWVARQVLACTHAPGAFTRWWWLAFVRDQRPQREMTLRRAWADYQASCREFHDA